MKIDDPERRRLRHLEYHHHKVHGDIIDPALLKAVDELAAKTDYESRESDFMLSGLLRGPDGSRYGWEFTQKKKHYYNRKVGERAGAEHLDKISVQAPDRIC